MLKTLSLEGRILTRILNSRFEKRFCVKTYVSFERNQELCDIDGIVNDRAQSISASPRTNFIPCVYAGCVPSHGCLLVFLKTPPLLYH